MPTPLLPTFLHNIGDMRAHARDNVAVSRAALTALRMQTQRAQIKPDAEKRRPPRRTIR